MHSTALFTSAAAAALLAGTALAAPTSPIARADGYYYTLSVTSTDGSGTYASHPVAACHAGALIEALCVYGDLSSNFTFTGNPGELQLSITQGETQSLAFLSDGSGSDNVQPAFFGGTSSAPVQLSVQDGSQSVGVYEGADAEAQYEGWYVCPYNFEGYNYETISFVAGGAEPSESGCGKVALQRAELI